MNFFLPVSWDTHERLSLGQWYSKCSLQANSLQTVTGPDKICTEIDSKHLETCIAIWHCCDTQTVITLLGIYFYCILLNKQSRIDFFFFFQVVHHSEFEEHSSLSSAHLLDIHTHSFLSFRCFCLSIFICAFHLLSCLFFLNRFLLVFLLFFPPASTFVMATPETLLWISNEF